MEVTLNVSEQSEITPPIQGMAELLKYHEPSKPLERGDVVEGEIMRIDQDGILVNIGLKNEGVIPSREMRSTSKSRLQELEVGSEVLVYVIHSDDEGGQTVLSLDKAQGEEGWRVLEKIVDTEETILGTIQSINKGGVVVDVEGIQGFIPLSQLAPINRVSDEVNQEAQLAQRIGEKIELRLLELNRRRNRVILSERQAVQKIREEQKNKLLEELKEGETRKGVISGMATFGAFVDLGGADGLIHISEMSWESVQSPDEIVKVGQELDVYILKVDLENRRIALSLRRLQPTPWDTVTDRYHVGQKVTGVITRLTNFGAFARIEDSLEGLIHISELSDAIIEHPKEVVKEGEKVALTILRIEPERRRLGLSFRQIDQSQNYEEEAGNTEVTVENKAFLLENEDVE